MDFSGHELYFSNMMDVPNTNTSVPTYGLYGEDLAQNGDLLLHCETISSRSKKYRFEIGLHRHRRFFQILYIEAGAGDAILGQQSHRLGPGSLVILPPQASHGFRFSPDIEGLVITIDSESLAFKTGANGAFSEALATPIILTIKSDDRDSEFIVMLLRQISAEFDLRRSGRNEVLASMVTTALMAAGRLVQTETRQDEGDPRAANQRIKLLYQLIDRHFREHRPATFYASQIGISATHLNRLARDQTGRSTHQLISNRLVDQARRDLVFTRISVQGIGYELGFSDPGYFTRFFTGQAGMSPSAYRVAERAKLSF